MIIILEEKMNMEIGYNKYSMKIESKRRFWKKGWIDCVREYLKKWSMIIINKRNHSKVVLKIKQ